MGAKRSPRKPKAQSPGRKMTLVLPRDVAKRLVLLAVQRETTIGELAAPAIKTMLAGSHFVDLSRESAPVADAPPELKAFSGSADASTPAECVAG